jgi:hypothetical protein
VRRRNNKIVKSAIRSSAIVSSMFPSNVRGRLYKEQDEKERYRSNNLKSYLRDSGGVVNGDDYKQSNSKPLADLFPETTIMVSNIMSNTLLSCEIISSLIGLHCACSVR